MADILRLQDNVPEQIALKYATPKIVESQMNGRSDAMYTLTDGRVTYLPLQAKSAIEAAGVRAYQPFEIVKVKRGRAGIDYEIRIMAEGAAATTPTATPAVRTTSTLPSQEHPQHNGGNAQPYTPAPAAPALPPIQQPIAPTAQRMAACFLVALDAVHEAQEYARRKGIGITFDSSNVTSAALSCYIQQCKEGR
jgi:cell division septation protein DedD